MIELLLSREAFIPKGRVSEEIRYREDHSNDKSLKLSHSSSPSSPSPALTLSIQNNVRAIENLTQTGIDCALQRAAAQHSVWLAIRCRVKAAALWPFAHWLFEVRHQAQLSDNEAPSPVTAHLVGPRRDRILRRAASRLPRSPEFLRVWNSVNNFFARTTTRQGPNRNQEQEPP